MSQTSTETINETKGNTLSIHCIACKRSTRHCVKVSLDTKGSQIDSDGWTVDWSDDYQVVECMGCETVSFRHQSWFSEAQEDGPTESVYPQRNKDAISATHYHNVPLNLRRIYKELIECFNNDSPILCAAGLRAIVEGICAKQGIIDGPIQTPAKGGGTQIKRMKTLEGQIAGLHEKGLLTESSAQTLHEHRYLGNDAVHELVRPSTDELKLAIEIVEHVLEQLYELPKKAADLRRATALRKK
jgi:hypothetical protein